MATAGQLLVTAGDNAGRLNSERSFARLCGVAPMPVSSGRTDRHRLHCGGDRDANGALWRIALVRMHCHQPTKNYVARRTADGMTKKGAMLETCGSAGEGMKERRGVPSR